MSAPFRRGLHLFRTGDPGRVLESVVARLGGRVGLQGVLGDLNREGRAVRVPAKVTSRGFRWQRDDSRTGRWFPRGISSFPPPYDADGRRRTVLCTSWCSSRSGSVHKGSRLSFVELGDPQRPRYRHVLLVEPEVTEGGRIDLLPVDIHAGGLAWQGRLLHVAAASRGLYSFRLDDIVRVPGGDWTALGISDYGRVDSFGYHYLLPLRCRYDAAADPGFQPMRYSFLSLDASGPTPELVAGEYGRRGAPTRLAHYRLDPATDLLAADPDGHSRPVAVYDAGIDGMQGVAVVDGIYYVATSAGRYRRGDLWVGRPGAFERLSHLLPAGPQDVAYQPAADQLWFLTGHPSRRYVFAITRAALA